MPTLRLKELAFAESAELAERGLELAERLGLVVWAIHRLMPVACEAQVLHQDNQRETCAREVRRAYETFQRMGAEREMRITRGNMREFKVRMARARVEAGGALSEQERVVVRLLGEHLLNKEIAGRMGISVRTVDYHMKNLYAKSGARTRSELVEWGRSLS